MMNSDSNEKQAVKSMALVGICGNIFLAVFKMCAGFIGHSTAMISDSIHTVSDIFATFIAYIGVVISKKQADEKHPYGHERLECVASIILSVILAVTGVGIGSSCIRAMIDGSFRTKDIPGILPVVAAIVSIAVKEAMFWYTMHYARLFRSGAFKADAWHHRSDALSSIGALVGILGARHGYPIADQIAGMIICVMILVVALRVFRDAVDKMLDTSCDEQTEEKMRQYVRDFSSSAGIDISVDLLRTRQFGEKIYVEMEIGVDGDMRLKEAHDIAERLHDDLEKDYPDIKHIMIHVNPTGEHA